jgi:methionine--tRNA ligase beta chain
MVFTYLDFFGEKERVNQLKESYTKGTVSDIDVKECLYKSLMKFFTPARKRYEELKKNPELVKNILARGAGVARRVAGQTIKEVREVVGLENTYEISRKKQVINIDDFGQIEMRVGKVTTAENVEKSEKLIRLHVDFGEFGKRTIFTGVRTYGYTSDDFLGKQFLFVVNLEPRKMMGEESRGMILATDGLELPFGKHGDKKPIFVSGEGLPMGAKVR